MSIGKTMATMALLIFFGIKYALTFFTNEVKVLVTLNIPPCSKKQSHTGPRAVRFPIAGTLIKPVAPGPQIFTSIPFPNAIRLL